MTETAALIIKVDSSDTRKATRDLDKLEHAATGNTKAAGKMGGAWKAAAAAVAVAAAYAAAKATTAFIRQADAFANMSARIGLVTGSAEELLAVQTKLFALAQESGQSLEAVSDLYAKLGQASEELAGNQTLLIQVTETVGKTLALAGADANTSAAVIRQFAQAMGAGALRGDELISIMEGAPTLVRAIADGMGVTVGEMRKLGAEGKLLASVVLPALVSQMGAVDEKFDKLPLTVGRATTQVKNALLQMVGTADQANGASAGLAQSISNLATVLSSEAVRSGFTSVIGFIVDATTAASAAVGKMAELWQAAQRFATFRTGGTNDVSDLAQIRYEKAELEERLAGLQGQTGADAFIQATRNRLAELKRLEEMSLLMFGDPSQVAVKMITGSEGSIPESARKALPFTGSVATPGGATGGVETTRAATTATRELTQAEIEAAMVAQSHADVRADAKHRTDEYNEAVKRGQAATDLLIGDMQFELELLGLTGAEREKAIALRYADAAATDEQRRAIADLAEQLETARDARRFIDDVKGAATDFASSALSGFQSVGDAFEEMADRMKRAAANLLAEKAIEWLFNAMFPGSGSNLPGQDQASGGGFKWAKGGVPNADLSQYSGSIVDKPTFFANGGNVMGEAGPEGIFPLKRGPDGKLGVVAMGGGGTEVRVIVHNNSGTPAKTTESTGPDGMKQIEVMIDQAVGKSLDRGSGAKVLQHNYGLRRAGVARGF